MNLTLIIYSLAFPGGAEKVMSIMANHWAQEGRQVTLLTLDDGEKPSFYDLHPAVVYRPLGVAGISTNPLQGVVNNLKRLHAIRRAVEDSTPEVVISFMCKVNVLTLMATIGLSLPVIVSERNDPSYLPVSKIWRLLRRFMYSRASRIVVQSQEVRVYFPAAIRRHVRIIPNPIPSPPATQTFASKRNPGTRTLAAMGSLTNQKGFDLLLQAFRRIAGHHPEWSLTVWGEGPLRVQLETQRDQLKLAERVRFPGRTRKPFEELRRADLFVLSSRYEGFPNALCEAMACGLPVISYDCPSGPRDIIRDGIDGLLVSPEDVEALAAAMDHLMTNEAERGRLSSRAPELLDRFGVDRIMSMWQDILREVTK